MFYAAIFFTILTLCFLLFTTKKPKNFPPGPRWYPILGSALEVSKIRQKLEMFCRVVEELAKTYKSSGTIGLKIGQDNLVIVHNPHSIKEMLTNEDLDGRPCGIFYKSRTFGSRKGILVVDEEFWQEQRRFIVRHLKDFGFARRGMVNMIQNEAQQLVEDFNNIIHKHNKESATVCLHEFFPVYILNTLWSMMSGVRYDRCNNEVVDLLEMFYELLKNVDMVGCLFSHFPFLRFIAPKYSGYRGFVKSHERIYEYLRKEVDRHRETFNINDEPRDLMDKYLQVLALPDHSETFSEQQLLAVCLDMFLAGSETSNKSLGFAFLHMVRNVSIQEKAQAELDAVIGKDRFPTWDDRVKYKKTLRKKTKYENLILGYNFSLPYCEAIVHEALRFFMGHTFGVPHRALRNTKLCGYDIPKDTMVIASFRGMLMDDEIFKNPHVFYPERFIENNKLVVPENFAPFGVGKHRCMGEIMGKQNLFCFITTLLHNFKFLPIKGQPLPSDDPVDGVTASVQPYLTMVVKR